MQRILRFLLLSLCFSLGINLNAQTVTILDESLLTQESFGTFTSANVTGFQNWYFNAQYGAVCSGYYNNQNNENEDWLISPVMNLSEADNALLSFSHTRGNAAVMNAGVNEGWYKVFATANYTGNPQTTAWIEVPGFDPGITTAWQYVSSGQLAIPEAARSEQSRIAFRYMSSATQSATWEIKNVKVTGEFENTNPGSDGVFDVTTWNVEWLGCTEFGPENEDLQLNNVAQAMLYMDSDIYCLQEVSNTQDWPSVASLVEIMGSSEWGGNIVPSDTGDCNQRQAFIYKKSKVQFVSATELSGGSSAQGNSYYFNWSGGRFPSVYNVNLIGPEGATIPLTLVNIHAKAEDNDAMSHTRRKGASEALKAILDGSAYNAKNVMVIGDFNDYLDGTTSFACNCSDSPYKNFMDDPANYTGITRYINDARITWEDRPIIDNIIISNELAGNYIANSALQETTVLDVINGYDQNTSNHLPVTATFAFDTMGESQFSKTSFAVYPNPVRNTLNITGPDVADNLEAVIYDITGRQILNKAIDKNTIDTSALPVGIYILKLGVNSLKFIKE